MKIEKKETVTCIVCSVLFLHFDIVYFQSTNHLYVMYICISLYILYCACTEIPNIVWRDPYVD